MIFSSYASASMLILLILYDHIRTIASLSFPGNDIIFVIKRGHDAFKFVLQGTRPLLFEKLLVFLGDEKAIYGAWLEYIWLNGCAIDGPRGANEPVTLESLCVLTSQTFGPTFLASNFCSH